MAIAQSTTRQQFPLSTKKIIKKTLLMAIVPLILLVFCFAVVAAIGATTATANTTILGSVLLALAIATATVILSIYLYQKWYFDTYYYDLNSDYIVIKKGPITPREITIPYERIQDVYVDQDLFDRLFGLYDVHLSSATYASGMQAHIDGVEKNAADGLRTLLLQTVSERISKSRKA